MFRILLIEDSFEIRENMKEFYMSGVPDFLKLDIACDCSDGLDKVRHEEYDLLMFDSRPRGKPGLDICRRISDSCHCPVVFITSLENDEEIDLGYAIGADDYIIKPFTPLDLYYTAIEYAAGKKPAVRTTIECGGIRINPMTGLVILDGSVIELPDKSTMILSILFKNKPNTVNRDTILKEVWGSDYSGDERVLDTQIKNLRKSLGNKGGLIQTVKGTGYRIKER